MTTMKLSGPRVLLVEDSMIIALDTEECLLELGASDVIITTTVANALGAIESDSFDLVLLDFGLGDESGEPVAEALRERAIPFWLATGHGELAGKVGSLGARGLLVKPFGGAELTQLMADFEADGRAT